MNINLSENVSYFSLICCSAEERLSLHKLFTFERESPVADPGIPSGGGEGALIYYLAQSLLKTDPRPPPRSATGNGTKPCIGGLRGSVRDARPPRFNFFHFHIIVGKFWPNNRLAAPPHPPSGKSWIRHWKA